MTIGWVSLVFVAVANVAIGVVMRSVWPMVIGPVVAGGLAVLLWACVGPLYRENALLRTGEPARARILRVWDTGTTVNDNPRIELELEIQRAGRPVYRTKTRAVVSRLQAALYQPGMSADVKVDPKKPERVVLVELAQGLPGQVRAAGGINADEWLAELEELNAYTARLSTSGEPARARIVRADDTGIKVNGNNPYMKFLLDVQPVGRQSFLAQAAGVIGEPAVARYQPGCEIQVRFDPSDTRRVALWHS
jgi:hypothetical protein